MSRTLYIAVGPLWVIMIIWLGMVICAGTIAFKVWLHAGGGLKRQMFYLWIGTVLVVIGDFIHSIAFTVAKYTGNPTGPIQVMGSVFEFRTFAMFFDGLAFILYYGLWALFIAARYRQGILTLADKVRSGMALAAAFLLLPGMIPNAFGIYSLEYDIAIWSPHILLFIIFGPWTVWELSHLSRIASAEAHDPVVKEQERALTKFCYCLYFSFLFFALTLSLRPINEKFSLFMIPKTFAYMAAYYFLIKEFLAPELRKPDR